jgi:hypothetical protein
MDGLPGDVARAGAAQEAHHRGDLVGRAAPARQRVVGQVMRGLARGGSRGVSIVPGATRFTVTLGARSCASRA